jgi:monofunctional biosynthetic peptidoglycan transglycosylase
MKLLKLGFKTSSIFLMALLHLLLIWGMLWIYQTFFYLPDPTILKHLYPHTQVNTKEHTVDYEFKNEKPKNWAEIKKMPSYVYGAFIVSEDWEFFKHRGYDFVQMQTALLEDLKEGTFKRGASTITQQLIKNLFLSSEKSLLRKYKELVLAIELEETIEKKKILETYLNVVEMGPDLYGISQASSYYFKKSVYQLTPKEAAFIAMLLPSPKKYSVSFRKKEMTKFARRSVNFILDKMRRGGFISEETRLAETNARFAFEKDQTPLEVMLPTDELVSEEEEVLDTNP